MKIIDIIAISGIILCLLIAIKSIYKNKNKCINCSEKKCTNCKNKNSKV